MSDYPSHEIVDMIRLIGEARNNYLHAARLYAERYPNRRHPHRTTMKDLCIRAEQGSLKRVRQKSGANEAKTVTVIASTTLNPQISTRQIERQHGVPRSTANRILMNEKFHPYHIHLVHTLEETDFARRLAFCNWVQVKLRANPAFVEMVLFSDEATFLNRGGVNRHNCHYYSDVNPHWKRHQQFQRQWSLNVWAGIVGDCIVGPFFFHERLEGENYLHFLREELPILLENVPCNIRQSMWFQQDGAPPHRSRNVTAYLNEQFPNKWIGLASPVQVWPPRSPDLTPLDFFLWGHVKEKVYATEPTTPQDMKMRIRQACREITPTVLQRVRASFINRINKCIEVNGRVFEHLR